MSGIHFLESSAELDSRVHRLPAGWKALLALIVVGAVAALPPRFAFYSLALVPLLLMIARAARVPLLRLLAHLAFTQTFVLGVALLALLQPDGLTKCATLLAKGTASVMTVQMLGQTTPFGELLALLTRLRVPRVVVATLALSYRYLFVLVEETQRMRRARAARTFVGGRLRLWSALANVIAQCFVRSLDRADRIDLAMRSRGFS